MLAMLLAPLLLLLGPAARQCGRHAVPARPDRPASPARCAPTKAHPGRHPDDHRRVGATQEVTTSETGKWNIQVDKEVPYVVKLDEKTLRTASWSTPVRSPSRRKFGATLPALLTVRTEDYNASTSKWGRVPPEQRERLAARAAGWRWRRWAS